MIPRSRNVYPPTVSQDRIRSLLNNSGHCLENCTGSRSGVDDTTISANLTTSNSTNAILSTSIRNRTRLISTNSSHCKENRTGSHLENVTTVSSKNTPSKPIRKSLRRNVVRNINVYGEGRRNTNPAHKDAFNLLISDLRKKSPQWDRK